MEHRWSEDCLKWVSRVPWNRYKEALDADGDLPEDVPRVEAREGGGGNGGRIVVVNTREQVPRDFHIRKEDAEKHGYTKGCGGCSSWFKGLARQPHNQNCRDRFAELMKEDAKFKNAAARKEEFEQRMKDKQRKKEDKKEEKKRRREGEEEEEAHKYQMLPPLDPNMASGSGAPTQDTEMGINQVMCLVEQWVCEVEGAMKDLDDSNHEDN